ncbi:MAG TPA: hypothetical protein VKE74_31555 [Gemmataceae bacterium]|nr:hypothetical protein [Gemmataceae bacterium]
MTPPEPTKVRNWAAWAVVVCLLAAVGEVGLLAATITDWQNFFPVGLAFVAFLVGPLVFLAVVAWRRRANPIRSRSLFHFAIVVTVAGLVAYGIAADELRSDPEARRNPLLNPTLVPLGQWLVVLAGWVRVNAIEKQEKRRGR